MTYLLQGAMMGVRTGNVMKYPTMELAMIAAHVMARSTNRPTPEWAAHCYGGAGQIYADSHWQGVYPDTTRPADGGPCADWYITIQQ